MVREEIADDAVDRAGHGTAWLPGTTQPSLTAGIEVGVPGRRFGSITSREMWFRSRRIEQAGQVPRDVGGTDIPADMPGQRFVAEAETLERRRHHAAGVIAQDQDRGAAGRVE